MIDETLPQRSKFDRRKRFAERLPMRKWPCVALGLTLEGEAGACNAPVRVSDANDRTNPHPIAARLASPFQGEVQIRSLKPAPGAHIFACLNFHRRIHHSPTNAIAPRPDCT